MTILLLFLTSVSDAHCKEQYFSDVLSKKTTIDLIAKRYGLKVEYVDGSYCVVFRTRPPMHWDNRLRIWKFGTMSQMIEKAQIEKHVCVVCEKGSIKIY